MQTAPGFGSRLVGYGSDYEKYAQIVVPRFRRMSTEFAKMIEPDSTQYTSPNVFYRPFSIEPPSTPSYSTRSSLDWLLETPRSDHELEDVLLNTSVISDPADGYTHEGEEPVPG